MVLVPEKATETVCHIELHGGDVVGAFFPWFQAGVWVVVPAQTTVGGLLTREWGLSREVIEERVGTVFLNGIPLDDLETSCLLEGDVLALSGPMPGLAGAILRKNSPLSVLRHDRRCPVHGPSVGATGPQRVRIKLFNHLIPELGPMLLRRGILLEKEHALECLRDWNRSGREKPRKVFLENKEVPFDALFDNIQISMAAFCVSD